MWEKGTSATILMNIISKHFLIAFKTSTYVTTIAKELLCLLCFLCRLEEKFETILSIILGFVISMNLK